MKKEENRPLDLESGRFAAASHNCLTVERIQPRESSRTPIHVGYDAGHLVVFELQLNKKEVNSGTEGSLVRTNITFYMVVLSFFFPTTLLPCEKAIRIGYTQFAL